MIQNNKTKIGIMGAKRNKQIKKNIIHSLSHIISIINKRHLNEEVKKELIKQVSTYPQGCLDHFFKNIESKIASIQSSLSPQTIVKPETEIDKKETVKKEKEVIQQRKPLFDENTTVSGIHIPVEKKEIPVPTLQDILRQAEARGQRDD